MLGRLLCLALVLAICAASYSPTPECDACRTLVEKFHDGWEEVVRRQAQDGKSERKSDAPPTITYNQDIEDYLQGFCKSTRITTFASYIQQGCKKVMDVHKREIVGKFLSVSEIVGTSMKATRVPQRTREVCSTLASECGRLPPAGVVGAKPKVKVAKCQACQRVMRDAQYVLRRSKKYTDKLKPLDVFEHLETLCPDVYNRYDDDPDSVFQVCEELFEDHEDVVLRVLAAKSSDAVEQVCVEDTDLCSSSEIETA